MVVGIRVGHACFKDEIMEGTPAIYLGRLVSKVNFRAFIYHPNGTKRLVESWDEFEANMQTGLWFATLQEAQVTMEVAKPKSRSSRNKKTSHIPDACDDEVTDDETDGGLAFEVTDDFLPQNN
jgi:hypothetical protein